MTTIQVNHRVNSELLVSELRAAVPALTWISIEAGADFAAVNFEPSAADDDPIYIAVNAAIDAHDPDGETESQRNDRVRLEKQAGLPADVVALLATLDAASDLATLKAVVREALLLAGRLAFVGGIITEDLEA